MYTGGDDVVTERHSARLRRPSRAKLHNTYHTSGSPSLQQHGGQPDGTFADARQSSPSLRDIGPDQNGPSSAAHGATPCAATGTCA